jgi:hypothetical protein
VLCNRAYASLRVYDAGRPPLSLPLPLVVGQGRVLRLAASKVSCLLACFLPCMPCFFQRDFLTICLLPLFSDESDLTGIIRTARYCQVLPGTARYCQVLPGTARYCQVLPVYLWGRWLAKAIINAKRLTTCTRPVAFPQTTPTSGDPLPLRRRTVMLLCPTNATMKRTAGMHPALPQKFSDVGHPPSKENVIFSMT